MRSEQKFTRARHTRRRIHATVAVSAGVVLGLATTAGTASAVPIVAHAASTSGVFATPLAAAPAALGVPTLTSIAADADGRIDEAKAALAEASSVTSEASGSGLDLGDGGATIPTAELQDAVDQLSATDLVPVFLLPALADTAAAQTTTVQVRVAEVRENLDVARAQRAAEEAAAEAQRQAEAAAAAAAAAAQRQAEQAAERAAERAAELTSVNTPDGAKAVARRMASEQYGWGSDQFSCLSSLWQRESGWNYKAYNASSGATGIPQALPGSKMASAGSDWQSNAATQIAWGLTYISSAYGSPCGAWGKSQSSGWY